MTTKKKKDVEDEATREPINIQEEYLEQLRSEGKCFQCQKSGHMAMDEDGPCRRKRRRDVRDTGQGPMGIPGISAAVGKNSDIESKAVVRFASQENIIEKD